MSTWSEEIVKLVALQDERVDNLVLAYFENEPLDRERDVRLMDDIEATKKELGL